MTTRFLAPAAPPILDVAALLRRAAHAALAVTALATVVLAVLAVRYVAFEYSHGVQPAVQHLLDTASSPGDRP
jgi:hypothetical protein